MLSQIENENEVFTNHIKPHDLWNYLYFIYCLQKKDETDYSGIEYEINDKINNDEVGWFPTNEEGDDDSALEEKMNELQQKIAEMKRGVLEAHDRTIKSLEEWTIKKEKDKLALLMAEPPVPAIEEVM